MVPEIRVQTKKPPSPGPGPVRPVRVHVAAPTKDRPAVSIETPRLILRTLEPTDQPAMIRLYEAAREHLSTVLPLADNGNTPESVFARQLELTKLGETTGKSFRRIATNRSGVIIGAFNLVVIRRGFENNADVNFWLDPKRTGVGLAQEGLLALMSYSLADLPEGLGMHRIDAWVQPGNNDSQKLVKSCGFIKSEDDASHLTTGEDWKVHERWELTIDNWQRDFG